MSMTVSDFVWHRLVEWGIKRVYGFPGDGVGGLDVALEQALDTLQYVQVRHEEMAAFMASAHAKFTGEVGLCYAPGFRMRQFSKDELVDFVVVGTGAGGGPLIAGLAEGGFSVVGFDAGPYFRPLEDVASDEQEQSKLYLNDERVVIDHDGLADAMFHLIRQNAAGSAAVLIRMQEVLVSVAGCERDPMRLAALQRHADLILSDAERGVGTPSDLDDLRQRHRRFVSVRQ